MLKSVTRVEEAILYSLPILIQFSNEAHATVKKSEVIHTTCPRALTVSLDTKPSFIGSGGHICNVKMHKYAHGCI
jgi:hypothetical protein